MPIPYAKIIGAATGKGGPRCYCCGFRDTPGNRARKGAFRAARKRADREAVAEGLADAAAASAEREASKHKGG